MILFVVLRIRICPENYKTSVCFFRFYRFVSWVYRKVLKIFFSGRISFRASKIFLPDLTLFILDPQHFHFLFHVICEASVDDVGGGGAGGDHHLPPGHSGLTHPQTGITGLAYLSTYKL